ncbi:MAG: phosphatase PAP2 family protein [Chthoniobacterales bacterium]
MRARFSAKGALGLHLTIGVLVTILFAWWFSEIAESLGPTTAQVALDHRVTNWFHAHARPGLTSAFRVLTFFGSVGFVTGMSVLGAIFFALRKRWGRLLALVCTMLGGSLLNILLKHFFHRQRPILENPLVTLKSFGFPSGHTMGSTMLYGVLALILVQSLRNPWARLLAALAAVALIGAVGLSRIYLGAHYLTDVLGAIAIGGAWLAFIWTTVETFRRRRDRAK